MIRKFMDENSQIHEKQTRTIMENVSEREKEREKERERERERERESRCTKNKPKVLKSTRG